MKIRPMPEHREAALTPEHCRRLTAGMKAGEEGAWREFHARYFQFLMAYAGSRGVSGPEAGDLVQATYLRILRHVKAMPEARSLEAWMRCLLRCELIDRARKRKRRLALMEKYAHWQETWEGSGQGDRTRVREVLEELSEGDQCLVLRSCVEGWSHQELAREACSTPKAIESKLARLRKRLRIMNNE